MLLLSQLVCLSQSFCLYDCENSENRVSLDPLLTLSKPTSLSYRNQFIDLLYKSMGWFLHDKDLHHGRVEYYLQEVIQRSQMSGKLIVTSTNYYALLTHLCQRSPSIPPENIRKTGQRERSQWHEISQITHFLSYVQ